jgi:glycosyltransferase involved in cell wall biosynthesis
MPVLNAAGIIGNCLQSIRRQDYPQDRIEILIGDAGSKDGTREVAQKYGALVFDDHGRNIEDGKRAALVHATGEYIIFIDADNEITHPDYVRLAVDALRENPNAFGVESYYLPSPKMTSFCAYLTHLLHISDPVAWMMSIKPVFLGVSESNPLTPALSPSGGEGARSASANGASLSSSTEERAGVRSRSEDLQVGRVSPASPDTGAVPTQQHGSTEGKRDACPTVERWTFPEGSLAYPVGSNGFVFRTAELDLVNAREQYSDTHTSVNLIQVTGKREWLRIHGRGVHHYYVATLGEFLKKRRRATCHFLDMQKEHGFSWTERKPRIPGWLACLLCATFIVPFFQTIVGLLRTRDLRWLWHPWASFFSALGVLWGVQTYWRSARDAKLIHKLQPRQTLKE